MTNSEPLHEMSATVRSMRHAEELVDVVLVFEETRVKCHRQVLAGTCEYFRRMFQTDMQESDAGEISIKEVSSTVGLLIVEYLYSGSIEIPPENAQELLAVSDRFLLINLKNIVEAFLCGQVGSTNCVSLQNLARLYSLESLLEGTQTFLTDHWKELLETEEIDQLTEVDLVALLKMQASDEDSFRLLQKWVRSSEGRTQRFMDLLQNVKLPMFSKEFVCRTVMCEKLMQNERGMQSLQQAMESFMLADRHQSLAVGDSELNFWFSVDNQQWQPIKMPPTKSVDYSVCSSVDGFIFSGGDDNYEPKCECYAYVAHARQWRLLPPMSVGRYWHASICDQNELMLIGGQKCENNYLDSVECLNLNSLEWSQFPPLPHALSETNPVYVQNKLFVVGGWLANSTNSLDVYEFDSVEKSWRSRCPMSEEWRGVGRAVSFDNKIFVVKGARRYCVHYDPCTDLWTQLQRPQLEHFCGPVLVWKDKIIVCGGEDTDSIEEYDPHADKWSTWDLKMPKKSDMLFAVITKRS